MNNAIEENGGPVDRVPVAVRGASLDERIALLDASVRALAHEVELLRSRQLWLLERLTIILSVFGGLGAGSTTLQSWIGQ